MIASAAAALPLPKPSRLPHWLRWLDSDYFPLGAEVVRASKPALKLSRVLPFAFLHVGCLAALWVGWSPFAVGLAVSLYWVRMFFVTGFMHRYFSHRSFHTSRAMQFVMALCCMTCVQRGPLWWAANHRHHHKYSDEETDLHSPLQQGFWWSHVGWMLSEHSMPTDYSKVKDLAKYPELVFLNRFDWLGSVLLALLLIALGTILELTAPQLGTNAAQLVVWGFFISTVVLFHGTVTINSLCHVWGNRRYETTDTSRNNFWLALITMGEGWHNNHHHCQGSCRQGFYWWEVDMTYYLLKGLSALGLVWNLHKPPASVYSK